VFSDGRSVEAVSTAFRQAEQSGASDSELVSLVKGNAMTTNGVGAFSLYKARISWTERARWATALYGLLIAAALTASGLFAHVITVPVHNYSTGRSVIETIDIGPVVVWAAVGILLFYLMFSWLAQFLLIRLVFLIGQVGLAIDAVAQIGGYLVSTPLGILALAVHAGYAWILLMSVISPKTRPVRAIATATQH